MILDDKGWSWSTSYNQQQLSITIINNYINEMFTISIMINTSVKNDNRHIDHDFNQNITLLMVNSWLRLLVASPDSWGFAWWVEMNAGVGNLVGETNPAGVLCGCAQWLTARREMDCDKVWSITLCSMQCLGASCEGWSTVSSAQCEYSICQVDLCLLGKLWFPAVLISAASSYLNDVQWLPSGSFPICFVVEIV